MTKSGVDLDTAGRSSPVIGQDPQQTSCRALPTKDDARRLLELLAPSDEPQLFAAIRGKQCTHRRGDLEELWPWLSEQNAKGFGIYYLAQTVHGKRRKLCDLNKIRALFLDLDYGGLPADLPCIDGAVIVETSLDRFQVVWPIPEISPSDFHSYIGGLLKVFPFADPKAKDEVRLLRLPGLYNTKPGRDGALVRVIREPKRKLTIEDLALFPRDDDYAREVFAKREREAKSKKGNGAEVGEAALKIKGAYSGDTAWRMARTIIKALRKKGEHRLIIRMKDGDEWEAGVKATKPWRKLAISILVAVGNLDEALRIVDTLSRGSYLSAKFKDEVREVYDWAQNLAIYERVLSPGDFSDLTGKRPITHRTFNSVYQTAKKLLGATRAVHARSNAVIGDIRAGRVEGQRVATEAHVAIIIGTRSGKFRKFLLELWNALRRNENKRYALTREAKATLCEKFGIDANALANFISDAREFFAIAPGRFTADRTVFIGWLSSPGGLAASLVKELASEAEDNARLSRKETNSSQKHRLLPDDDIGSNQIGIAEGVSYSQAKRDRLPAGHHNWTRVDEVGLRQLQTLARMSKDAVPEVGFWLHLVEKGVAHWRIDEALVSATTRAAKVHAEGVGSEIWHICRSTKLASHQAAAIIARANASVLWQIENGHLDTADARVVLKAYRRALARKALDFGVWTPGAERLQHQAEWLARNSAEDALGSPTPERNASGADIA